MKIPDFKNFDPKNFNIDYWKIAGLKGKPKDPNNIYATGKRRSFAMVVDLVIAIVIIAPIFQAFYPPPHYDLAEIQQRISSATSPSRALWHALLETGIASWWLNNMLLQTLVFNAGCALCWQRWGATPGKMLFRMRIVDAKTLAPISAKQAWLRFIGYWVSTIALGLGFLWIDHDKRHQAWHDKIAGTVVVVLSKIKNNSLPQESA